MPKVSRRPDDIDKELLFRAHEAARAIVQKLPRPAQTEHTLVLAQAHLYDCLRENRRLGEPYDDAALRGLVRTLWIIWQALSPEKLAADARQRTGGSG